MNPDLCTIIGCDDRAVFLLSITIVLGMIFLGAWIVLDWIKNKLL